jgi:type IV secretion system protein VirB9
VRRQGVLDRERHQNFAYVKPAKSGSTTNLNLVAASGYVYSFTLSEVPESPDHDLKIFVEPRDESMTAALNGRPRFVAVEQIEDYRQQAEIARSAARETRLAAESNAEREIGRFRHEYPASLKFAYRYEAAKKPFDVSAIYHDGRFTYIRANPEETPALYEVKDGKPNLVQFEFRQGLFVVSKVLDAGYLAIGKQSLPFQRREVGDE